MWFAAPVLLLGPQWDTAGTLKGRSLEKSTQVSVLQCLEMKAWGRLSQDTNHEPHPTREEIVSVIETDAVLILVCSSSYVTLCEIRLLQREPRWPAISGFWFCHVLSLTHTPALVRNPNSDSNPNLNLLNKLLFLIKCIAWNILLYPQKPRVGRIPFLPLFLFSSI